MPRLSSVTVPVLSLLAAAATTLWATPCAAQILVPPGFVVDQLLGPTGTTPRLTAITNPAYGTGVMSASVDNGILTVRRISSGNVEVFGTFGGLGSGANVRSVLFDSVGSFGGELLISVETNGNRTRVLRGAATGDVQQVAQWGSASNVLAFLIAESSGVGGYLPGAYLFDSQVADGTSLWHMDASFAGTQLASNSVPTGRSDMDMRGIALDTVGLYGSRILLADSDPNHDNITAIYSFLPDLTYELLTTPVNTQTRFYHDMTLSAGGAFGQSIYVTERVNEALMTVDPAGVHDTFATGFVSILSASASADGNVMYVSDAAGIHRIREAGTQFGPTVVMREPSSPTDTFCDDIEISTVRVLFSEPIVFSSGDVSVVNSAGQAVLFSVQGSGTAFVLISLGTSLVHDTYTVTIADTAVSQSTGTPIDGDNNGTPGGDYTLDLTHRCDADCDHNGTLNILDYICFGDAYAAGCP